MDNWHGKHPIPWDYFYSMNTGSGQNLDWFWQNWYFSNNYIDLKVSAAEKSGKNAFATIDNVGRFMMPFDLVVKYEDGSTSRTHYKADVWKNSPKQIRIPLAATKKIATIEADGGIFMDYTPQDNKL